MKTLTGMIWIKSLKKLSSRIVSVMTSATTIGVEQLEKVGSVLSVIKVT
jgi:hypothetical protein